MSVQSPAKAPKVRLETVKPESVIRFVGGQRDGQVGITQPQGSWAAGTRVLLVADLSVIHISNCAFVQVVAS